MWWAHTKSFVTKIATKYMCCGSAKMKVFLQTTKQSGTWVPFDATQATKQTINCDLWPITSPPMSREIVQLLPELGVVGRERPQHPMLHARPAVACTIGLRAEVARLPWTRRGRPWVAPEPHAPRVAPMSPWCGRFAGNWPRFAGNWPTSAAEGNKLPKRFLLPSSEAFLTTKFVRGTGYMKFVWLDIQKTEKDMGAGCWYSKLGSYWRSIKRLLSER
jgi:hypothetical protein